MERGEIRWYRFAQPDKRRPVLLLTRSRIIQSINEIIVVPITRTVRGIATEVVLTTADGMPTTCALNCDHLALGQRSKMDSLLARLSEHRWLELEQALLIACGFREPH